jgi:hypothetical protein
MLTLTVLRVSLHLPKSAFLSAKNSWVLIAASTDGRRGDDFLLWHSCEMSIGSEICLLIG